MDQVVLTESFVEVVQNLPMIVPRHLGHLQDSSGQFVVIPWFLVGLAKFVERHLAAMVGQPDLNTRG